MKKNKKNIKNLKNLTLKDLKKIKGGQIAARPEMMSWSEGEDNDGHRLQYTYTTKGRSK